MEVRAVTCDLYRSVMADLRCAAVALAAMELLPAEAGDLAALLEAPAQRQALLRLHPQEDSRELTGWLCSQIDHGRIEHWEKRLDALTHERAARVVLAGDGDYPARLASTWNHPPVLFVRGELQQHRPAMAIVGSRATSEAVLQATSAIAQRCAEQGWSVVSGLAAGADSAAHRGALAAGGHTIAVMGTGITRIFPPENADLAEDIAASGALVSQFTPDAPRTGTTFLWRNAVIAALADVDLVMDGQGRSGSRHQCEQAVRQGRPVLLWRPTLSEQPWARALVEDGSASFVGTSEDVMAVMQERSCAPA